MVLLKSFWSVGVGRRRGTVWVFIKSSWSVGGGRRDVPGTAWVVLKSSWNVGMGRRRSTVWVYLNCLGVLERADVVVQCGFY